MIEENIENNLVFCIDRRKTFRIKSIQKSGFFFFFEIRHIRSKYVLFFFRFIYKTMTKQTVYLNNFARENAFRLQFLRQSAV